MKNTYYIIFILLILVITCEKKNTTNENKKKLYASCRGGFITGFITGILTGDYQTCVKNAASMGVINPISHFLNERL